MWPLHWRELWKMEGPSNIELLGWYCYWIEDCMRCGTAGVVLCSLYWRELWRIGGALWYRTAGITCSVHFRELWNMEECCDIELLDKYYSLYWHAEVRECCLVKLLGWRENSVQCVEIVEKVASVMMWNCLGNTTYCIEGCWGWIIRTCWGITEMLWILLRLM